MATELLFTSHRLLTERQLTVGYLGGSLTEGTGASDAGTASWRARTTAWLARRYPDAAIREINAGIGGTGSDYGACRCGSDLLAGNPDLVFVEFAVNDGDKDPRRVSRSMEGIVRQVLRHNPLTDIVFIYTTNKNFGERSYPGGRLCESIAESGKIARHYGIPEINVGKTLWQRIADGRETWATLTTDTTHPTDRGYALYAEQVTDYLKRHLDIPEAPPSEKALPEPLNRNPFENARAVEARRIADEDWTEETDRSWGGERRIVVSSRPGAEARFAFHGSAVGASWVVDADSGRIECVIDGRASVTVSAFDKYCLSFRRLFYFLLDDLPDGDHTAVMRVLPTHDEQSRGTWIRFHTFLMG